MTTNPKYSPGPASGASIEKDGDQWTLVVTRELRHPPARVWQAITDPKHLIEWAPFDADRSLSSPGPVTLTTVGTPKPMVADIVVKRAEEPRFLEYNWGGSDLRWQLEPVASGTRLTLWHNINKGFISMGAAGWHVCFDVMDRFLSGEPIGRIVGPAAMQFEGWQRLNVEYAKQFGVELPKW